ncbi:hypothetical protein IAT40_005773 [Kwoniella sp. CBS 6097]
MQRPLGDERTERDISFLHTHTHTNTHTVPSPSPGTPSAEAPASSSAPAPAPATATASFVDRLHSLGSSSSVVVVNESGSGSSQNHQEEMRAPRPLCRLTSTSTNANANLANLTNTRVSRVASRSPHFTPLPGNKLPISPTMQRRYNHYHNGNHHASSMAMATRSQAHGAVAYPSPSPDPEIRVEDHNQTRSFSDKVLQSEERLISRELKVKHGGQGRFVRIVEVSARDGLQNLPGPPVPTEVKRELVERLLDAGLRNIEVGSFVRGDWVPQMADTSRLLPTLPRLTGQTLPLPTTLPSPPSSRPDSPSASSSTLASSPLSLNLGSLRHKVDTNLLPPHAGDVHFPVLVPNMRGLDNLVKLQEEWSAKGGGPLTDEIAVFVSATEAFSQANNHAPLEKILSSLPPVINKALSLGLRVRGYVSCVITCPYSGPTDPKDAVAVAKRLLDMGCYEISLGDTTGEGDPASWARLWAATRENGVDMSRVACHDTFSLALSSLCTLLPEGLSSIDSSLAGLGGCPYSPGATGNVPTEDVVYTLHKLGYETGVDLDKLVEAGNWLAATLGVRNESRVGRAIWARRVARERAQQQAHTGQAGSSGAGAGGAGKEGTKGVLEETEDGM